MCAELLTQRFEDEPFQSLYEFGVAKDLAVAQYDAYALGNTTYDINLNLRQWTYQYCTEFGWFQVPYQGNYTRSPALNLTFWPEYCRRTFGQDLPYPAVEETNAEFGGLNNQGKNIYFFNAIEDPWQYAGMRSIPDPDEHPDQRAWLINCTNCAHCIDLKPPLETDAQNLKDGRADAIELIYSWMTEPYEVRE